MDRMILNKVKNRLSLTYLQSEMNYWAASWDLDADGCPCDLHFNDWVASRGLRDQTFYHFGTGTHHVIGVEQAENGSGNRVYAITASIDEYKSYIRLATRRPAIARSYIAYFGDIYLTDPKLLPDFDAVTLFHLSEFYCEDSAAHGGQTDLDLLELFTDKTRVGGHLLFYTGSFAYATAQRWIDAWAARGRVEKVEDFKSLTVYRRVR